MFWILVLLFLTALFYWKLVKPMHYWKERGVNQGKPVIIFGDNWGTMLKKHSFADMVQYVYKMFPNTRYSGMYQFSYPTLMLRSPELIKQIGVKDFDHFLDHRFLLPEEVDPLWAKNLFSLRGEKWRDMRATLSPAFTSSKMKAMFAFMLECGERFANYFTKECQSKDTITVEMKDALTRYTNDVIASSAFGVSCDSLANRNNEFYLMGKDATNFRTFWRRMKFFVNILMPSISQALGIGIFSKQVSTFFTSLVKETIHIREKEGIIRPDMIHLLMEARKGRLKYDELSNKHNETGFATVEESQVGREAASSKKEAITDVDITAQALIFFIAGFDSVSTLMSFMSYELAVNPDIQDKLYEEIKTTITETNGKLTYEALLKMKYMDMVVSETLRKWPPAVAVDRVCVKPYTINPETPDEVPVHLKEGDLIWIPIFALHYDKNFFPEPDRFDPERFSDENKEKIVPYSYIPFGVGPRNCIGSRFALLETKVVIYYLLSKFEIVPVEKTPIPMILCKKNFTLTSETDFWVGLKIRK